MSNELSLEERVRFDIAQAVAIGDLYLVERLRLLLGSATLHKVFTDKFSPDKDMNFCIQSMTATMIKKTEGELSTLEESSLEAKNRVRLLTFYREYHALRYH